MEVAALGVPNRGLRPRPEVVCAYVGQAGGASNGCLRRPDDHQKGNCLEYWRSFRWEKQEDPAGDSSTCQEVTFSIR